MLLKKGLLIIALSTIGSIAYALPIDESVKAFTDGYIQGYEDGFKSAILKTQDFCHYIEGAKIFDDLLINGIIPPPKIKAKWQLLKKDNGLTYERKLIVEFQPVNMNQLMQYKEFADYLVKIANEREKVLPSGYFYIVITNPLPKPYRGLIEFITKKYISDDAVVGIEENGEFYLAKTKTLADAKFILHRLSSILEKLKNKIEVKMEIERL